MVLSMKRKPKALIRNAVTAKLVCFFVFAYAKSRFSHDEAHLITLLTQTFHLNFYKANGTFFSKPLCCMRAKFTVVAWEHDLSTEEGTEQEREVSNAVLVCIQFVCNT